ncbi:MAG: DUF1501 domain-containing protein, partial [Pirellulaceae bacterium]|nr:DUF1501 domain-containing protein [Pirellulaceae bacterium]
HTDQINHDPAHTVMNTGTILNGRPSMGAWVNYALGSENHDLPGFVVMTSVGGGQDQPIASRQWHSGFLPSRFLGVPFHSKGDAVLYVKNPPGVATGQQKDVVEAIQQLNGVRDGHVRDPEIATRIASYEMAARLQVSAPELTDLSSETQETLDLYGCDPAKASFARACLLARRMVQRGVRYINIFHSGWDAHSNVAGNVKNNAGKTDQGSAALVKDLKRLGMLDSTLVIWGGEFGRTPMVETNPTLGRSKGRDHHPQAYSLWMAGGSIKPGLSIGKTDDFGFHPTEDAVHVHDVQATILQQLGLDHERLTYHHAGRDFRLTDVHGAVIEKILS